MWWDQAYSISRKFLGHLWVCTYWGGTTLRCSKSMFLSMVLFRFSIQSLSLTLWDPMDCSTPSFPVHHQLLELVQTHVHRVGNAIQPSHPLSSPSPPSFNFSQHQGLFQWVSSSHHVAKVSELQLQHQSFQSISPSNEYSGLISFRMDWLDLLAVQGTLKNPPIPQFKSINSLVLSFLYSPPLTSIHDYWKNHSFD